MFLFVFNAHAHVKLICKNPMLVCIKLKVFKLNGCCHSKRYHLHLNSPLLYDTFDDFTLYQSIENAQNGTKRLSDRIRHPLGYYSRECTCVLRVIVSHIPQLYRQPCHFQRLMFNSAWNHISLRRENSEKLYINSH